jgi:hypothetical protein
MSLIFISYRREDSAGYAGRLHESLERRLGKGEVFRDADALEPGEDFVDAIAARLRHCRACLVVIGREWVHVGDTSGRRRLERENDYVRLEIAAALARPDVLVIPVLVESMAMPVAEELPEAIRALSRRHAASLRDETWDADVDRLVRTVRKSIGEGGGFRDFLSTSGPPTSRLPLPAGWSLKWAVLAVTLLAVILVARTFRGADDDTETLTTTTAVVTRDGPGEAVEAPAYAIATPRLAEIAHGDLIYTLLSGGVTPHGSDSTVRLRFRFSNEGGYPANFWDSSFRLAVRGQVLAPTSGLNEVVADHSLQQGVVSFEVPADATEAVLRVLGADETAELPLNLTSTGALSEVNNRDTTDALSRAIVVGLVRNARPLVSGQEISYTLVSATARRFVNTLRIFANVRITNHGRFPLHFGTDAVRLIADGQATAPVEGPNEVVASDAMAAADFVFDVGPSVRQVILRVTGESVAEVSFDLPSAVR